MMYVRYLGTKVCWTIMDGSERFYMGDRDELTDEERTLCESGGGELPVSVGVDTVAY